MVVRTREKLGLALLVCALSAGCGLDWPHDEDAGDVGDGGELEADAGGAQTPGTDGSVEEIPGDAGLAETDASEPGSPDAGSSDSGGDPTYTPDSSPAPDAGSFCDSASAHDACADFDTSTLDDWSWLELSSNLGSTLAITQDGVAPGVAVMRARTTGAVFETAMAAYALPATLSEVTVTFDVRLELGPALDELVVWAKIQQQVVDNYPGVSLATSKLGTLIAVQNWVGGQMTYNQYDLPAMPTGWVRVRLRVVLGTAGTLEVQYDDQPPTRFTNVRVQSEGITQSQLGLGLYTQDGLAASAYFDNAVLDYSTAP